jgi:hypothetical protein
VAQELCWGRQTTRTFCCRGLKKKKQTKNKKIFFFSLLGHGSALPLTKFVLVDGKGKVGVGYNVVSDETRALMPSKATKTTVGDSDLSPGYVRFFVYEANNLMAKDSNGLSDPYVVLMDTIDVNGKECKTKVMKKTLSPKWSEAFTFQVPNIDKWAVRLKIFDWDVLGKDELGYADVLATTLKEPKVVLNVIEGKQLLCFCFYAKEFYFLLFFVFSIFFFFLKFE